MKHSNNKKLLGLLELIFEGTSQELAIFDLIIAQKEDKKCIKKNFSIWL